MPYESDPWWRNLRTGLFISFWIAFTIIFFSSFIITLLEFNRDFTVCHVRNISKSVQLQLPSIITSAIGNSLSGISGNVINNSNDSILLDRVEIKL